MKTHTTTMRCPRCGGKGEVALDGELQTTLELVQKMKSVTSTTLHAQIKKTNPIGITAVNNRLEDLRKLGLLTRHRHGRQWVYTKTKTK